MKKGERKNELGWQAQFWIVSRFFTFASQKFRERQESAKSRRAAESNWERTEAEARQAQSRSRADPNIASILCIYFQSHCMVTQRETTFEVEQHQHVSAAAASTAIPLRHRGHSDRGLGLCSVCRPPQTRHCLGHGEEVDGVSAIEGRTLA